MFLCVHNAGRSQMAAGWAAHLAGSGADILSGGSDPEARMNPSAVAAMAEVGIDTTSAQPRRRTDEDLLDADVPVTMGCGDTCPIVSRTSYLDWHLADPAGQGVVAAELVGAIVAVVVARLTHPDIVAVAHRVVVPHGH